jgi:hypothetical protein
MNVMRTLSGDEPRSSCERVEPKTAFCQNEPKFWCESQRRMTFAGLKIIDENGEEGVRLRRPSESKPNR